MDNLINYVVDYLIKNNLDGFDIDWEFPASSKDAKSTDRKGFATLLQKLRQKFNEIKPSLLITLAVSAPFDITKVAYEIDALNK
uniref:GH18 domain-containing protein n=1 Tax=Acrobeloides nanus TaxID=290746 RepID=A0A914E6R4_9BILA